MLRVGKEYKSRGQDVKYIFRLGFITIDEKKYRINVERLEALRENKQQEISHHTHNFLNVKILFWNTDGLRNNFSFNKINSFLKTEVNIFCCVETWCTSSRLREFNWFNNLKNEFDVIEVDPTKSNLKGRMKGGNLLCIKKLSFVYFALKYY